MNLWKKTVLIVSLTFLILTIILYFVAQNIMLRSFIELESQMASDNVRRALNALNDDIKSLSAFTADWASWDDSYKYINDLNKEYRETNLVDTSFTVLKINFLIFINTDGLIVFKRGFDLKEEAEIPVPQSLLSHIKLDSVILRHGREGFLNGHLYLPEGAMIISSHPILTSEDRGPSRGTLIMARFLDAVVLEDLAERTRLSLQIHDIESDEMPKEFLDAKKHLTDESPVYVKPHSEKTLWGFSRLKDIFGKPVLLLGAEMERNVYLQGRNSVTYFIISIVFVIVISGIIMLLYLNWLYRTYKD
jgi:sensor domain CHASE-containing protein